MRNKQKESLWDLLTFIVVMVIFVTFVFVGLIYTNPQTIINPFPPEAVKVTEIYIQSPPSETITLPEITTTSTPTLTASPTPTISPSLTPAIDGASATPTVSSSPMTVSQLDTPTPIEENPTGKYIFMLKSTPAAIQASILNPERSCNWMGIGGQVLDIQGRPATGITVLLSGAINGSAINLTSLTGTAIQYGPAGFEFTISTTPTASKQSLWVRLTDQTGIPISEKVFFDTFDKCEQNQIIINFKQVK